MLLTELAYRQSPFAQRSQAAPPKQATPAEERMEGLFSTDAHSVSQFSRIVPNPWQIASHPASHSSLSTLSTSSTSTFSTLLLAVIYLLQLLLLSFQVSAYNSFRARNNPGSDRINSLPSALFPFASHQLKNGDLLASSFDVIGRQVQRDALFATQEGHHDQEYRDIDQH